MISALVLAKYAFPPDEPPTTGGTLCDVAGSCIGRPHYTCHQHRTQAACGAEAVAACTWSPPRWDDGTLAAAKAVPCETLPLGDGWLDEFAERDVERGHIATLSGEPALNQCMDNRAVVDRRCTNAGWGKDRYSEARCAATRATNGEMCQWHPYSYNRRIKRYPADPPVKHLGKKACMFVFALTEYITVGMYPFLSVATTDAIHPEKNGFPFYKFRCCGSKRDSSGDASVERRQEDSESWFQRWWNYVSCKSCHRRREPSTDSSSSESSRSDSELSVTNR